MKSFVKYSAHGVVHRFNKSGRAIGVLRGVYCDGVARLDRNFMGAIHRQNPDLLPCNAICVSWREL